MLNKRGTARFCSQTKMLLASGIPLVNSLEIARGMLQRREVAGLQAVIEKIKEGQALSEAAVGWLPALALGSIRAAEGAGEIEASLGRLSKYYQDKAEMEEKLINALLYPAFILLLCFFSVLALVFLVLPGMRSIFSDLGADLPPLTGAILGLSDFLTVYGLHAFAAIVAGAIMLRRRILRGKWEEFLLRAPGLNRMFTQQLVIHWFGTMGTLLNGGTSITEAFNVTANASGSKYLKRLLEDLKEKIENGNKMSAALEEVPHIRPEIIQMVEVGEGAGKLGEMLVHISNLQEKERELFLKRFTALFEPCMTLSVGVVVGVVVLALFLPLIDLISNIK